MGRFLPKGAGAVRCTECGDIARADGKGTPIILKHKPNCSESTRVTIEFRSVAVAEAFKKAIREGSGFLQWDWLGTEYDYVNLAE